jgi:hypothetical protein
MILQGAVNDEEADVDVYRDGDAGGLLIPVHRNRAAHPRRANRAAQFAPRNSRRAIRAAQLAPRNPAYTPRQFCNAHPVVPVLLTPAL